MIRGTERRAGSAEGGVAPKQEQQGVSARGVTRLERVQAAACASPAWSPGVFRHAPISVPPSAANSAEPVPSFMAAGTAARAARGSPREAAQSVECDQHKAASSDTSEAA